MNLEITIDTLDNRKASAVAEALASDSKSKRGTVSFKNSRSNLIITISSDDSVALRAAVNSSLRVADACLSIIE